MNLTTCQKEGNDKIGTWLPKKTTSLSDRIFVLTGKAGTGKTTLIKYALGDYIKDEKSPMTQYAYPAVAGVCIAHKAKNVLTGSIPDCFTYAGYFGHKVDYHPNGQMFFKKKNVPYYKFPHELPIPFVVHDECSMYDKARFEEILNTTHHLTKIIFMGDPGQLPPINSDGVDIDSPVFTTKIPASSKHHLVERVRQTDENPIVELSDIVYDEIFGQQRFKPVYEAIREDKKNDKGEGYETVYQGDLVDKYMEVSKGDPLETKVVAYRNKTVNDINNAIRFKMFSRKGPNGVDLPPEDLYLIGDNIVMNKTFTQGNDKSNKDGYTFYNADEYTIASVKVTKLLDVEVYRIRVDNPGKDHHLSDVDSPILHVIHPNGIQAYKRILDELYSDADATKDKKMRKIKFQQYHDFKSNFADVSYGYCFTAYKAQGSTFRNVFVDMNDIRGTMALTKKRKLQSIYTAMTRASHNVYFLSQFKT